VALPGLRPADAEALLRSCGVTGDAQAIQNYLKSHCDCHPLVTGILGGLINDYFPARGEFDAWAADPASGGQLNLADLDLLQKRNHILKAALDAVPKSGRQILSLLALMSEAVDYATLSAINPNLSADTVRNLERRGAYCNTTVRAGATTCTRSYVASPREGSVRMNGTPTASE
jgi:hypothetical protein